VFQESAQVLLIRSDSSSRHCAMSCGAYSTAGKKCGVKAGFVSGAIFTPNLLPALRPPIPIHWRKADIANQRMRLAAPNVAFKITALRSRLGEFESHAKRFILCRSSRTTPPLSLAGSFELHAIIDHAGWAEAPVL